VDADYELRSFANVLAAAFNDGVSAISPPAWKGPTLNAKLDTHNMGLTKSVQSTSGSGVSIEVMPNGNYKLRKAGQGYVKESRLEFQVGEEAHRVTVSQISKFGLTKAAIECILHIVTSNWNSLHGVEPDLVSSEIQIDPPRAVRTNVTKAPKDTPGWKLLRVDTARAIPQLVVGGGRRPLLALRRLRAFIKLGSGTISKANPEKFKSHLPAKSSTLSTEIFALLEGSSVAYPYKVAILGLLFVLEGDVPSLGGLWAAQQVLLSSVVQQLVKPSVDTASADAVTKAVMAKAKAVMNQQKEAQAAAAAAERAAALARKRSGSAATAAKPTVDQQPGTETGTNPDSDEVIWAMVKTMVTFVKKEFDFHIPNLNDPGSSHRRERLDDLFEELPAFGALVQGLGVDPAVTTKSVLEAGFQNVADRGGELLANMLGGEGSQARSVMSALLFQDQSKPPRERFGNIMKQGVSMLTAQFKSAHPHMMESVEGLAEAFTKIQDSELGSRHLSFPPQTCVGKLLSKTGLSTDVPELHVLDAPQFWENVYSLFLRMRDPPPSDASVKVVEQWRTNLVQLLSSTCALTVPGGLLYEVVKVFEDEKAQDMFDKFRRIGALRKTCAGQVGLMSVRERTTWYKEFSRQVLVGRYGPPTAGTKGSGPAPTADKKVDPEDVGEHPLLGTAMFVFDLWTWVPDATDGRTLQQSVLRLQQLLKDSVQLAVELAASNVMKSNPLRRRTEQKRRIAYAASLIDAAFEIPRAIAGPAEESWNFETESWANTLVIDWNRMAARILAPASVVLSATDKYKPKTEQGLRVGPSAATIVEALRVVRDVKNSYGKVLELSVALDALPSEDDVGPTAQGAHQESFITLDTEVAGGPAVAGGDPEGGRVDPAIVLEILDCLGAHLKTNRIIMPWKVAAMSKLSTSLLGPQSNPDSKTSWRGTVHSFLTSLQHILKLEGGVVAPNNKTLLWDFLLADDAISNDWTKIQATLEISDKPALANLGNFTKKEINRYAAPASSEESDPVVSLAVKYFPMVDPLLNRLLEDLLVGKRLNVDTILAFLSHPLLSLTPARQVGTLALVRKECEKEAVAMVASIPQIAIQLEISEAGDEAKPTLRMVANAIDKVMRYALAVDKSPEVMQSMLEEMVGDMIPRIARPHVTLPILDSLNGRQGLVTLARSHIGAAAKRARMQEMTKDLALTIGTKIFGVNDFIARRAVDVMAASAGIQANVTHEQKLNTLGNERNLLNTSVEVTTRACEVNGVRPATAKYVLAIMKTIYTARWLQNSANFEHFALELDDQDRMKGALSARAKILLLDCSGAITAMHSALLRRVIEFASVGAAWTKEVTTQSDKRRSSQPQGGAGISQGGRANIAGKFSCPTCRVVSDSIEGVFSADKLCCICNELEVDCIFPACRHIVACQRCMLQMQQSAADAAKPPQEVAAKPGFLFVMDQSVEAKGFTDPVGVHRQLKGIYGCLCKLMFPDALEWDSPWSPWSEVSKKLSKDAHDYQALREFVQQHESVLHIFDSGKGQMERLATLTSKSAGVVQTIKAMTTILSEKLSHLEADLKFLTLQTISGARCTFFGRILHSRMPLVPTLARLKRACMQPAFLSGVHSSYRFTL
jgi:hypothetical protein